MRIPFYFKKGGIVMIDHQLIFACVTFAIALYTFYTKLKTDAIQQATAVALMQKELQHLVEVSRTHTRRLDDHDDQNKALVALTEQIKSLTEKVKEIQDELRGGKIK